MSGSNPEKERLHVIATLASRIVSLESDLAHAGAQPEDLFDPSKAYNPTAFDELNEAMPVNLTAYVSSFVGKDKKGVIGQDVVVTSKAFVEKMGKILEDEEDWVLQAWFGVRAAMEYGAFLGDKVEVRKTTSALKNLLSGVRSGADVDREEGKLISHSHVLPMTGARC
jgi:predicted metalloendopeptidase